jgi:hypothetical protein
VKDRSSRIVLIAFVIVEAILIFGVVVPTILRRTSAGDRPRDTGALHE